MMSLRFCASLGALFLLGATAVSAQECGRLYPGLVYELPPGPNTNAVALGDLNNDGRNDIVVTRWRFGGPGSRVQVLLGADGGHALASSLDLPEAYDLALGDIDGDGNPDAVVTGPFSTFITVLLGDGAGGLASPVAPAPTGAAFTESVSTGDFDGDGDDDVAIVTHTPSTLRIYQSTGGGNLTVSATLTTGASPLEVRSADFDQDGAQDLAVLHRNGVVTFFAGDGSGGFAAVHSVASSSSASSFMIGDFDADPRPELVVANATDLTYLDGAAGFQFAASPISAGIAFPEWIAALDADHDGDQDIAVLLRGSGKIQMIRGNGNGAFSLGELGVGDQFSVGIAAGDLDGDGLEDLVSVSGWPQVTTCRQRPEGGIELATAPRLTSDGDIHKDLVTADLNGDGHTDVLTVDWGPKLRSHLGDGSGTFARGPFTVVSASAARLAADDLNGDGVADAAVAYTGSFGGTQSLLELRAGAGDGSFATLLDSSNPLGPNPAALLIADVNGDDDQDVIVLASNGSALPGTVTIRQGLGGGSFQPGSSFSVGLLPMGAAAGDLDLDGDLDLVVCSYADDQITVALGDGLGGFSTTMFPSGQDPRQVSLLDLDGNGLPDLATALSQSALEVRLGAGGGAFGAPVLHDAPAFGSPMEAADFDGDGDDDLAVGGGPLVKMLSSRGDGTLGDGGAYRLSSGVRRLAVADFDEDGSLDVLGLDHDSFAVLLKNRVPAALPWTDLGGAAQGSNGLPVLTGRGVLMGGCPASLELSSAAPSSAALLFLSTASTPIPFKGGTLFPWPPLTTFLLATGAAGELTVSLPAWPPGLTGLELFFQYVIADPGAAGGASLSNGVRADVP